MSELDVRALFERAVVNGLESPDPLVRRRNALRVPTDAHSGPAVRATLVRLAAEDPSEEVRAACMDALAFVEPDPVAIAARLADAASEPTRLDRLREWVRSQLTVLVPAPAMGPGAWPYFGPTPGSVGTTGVPPKAELDGSEVVFERLPADLEGARLRILRLAAPEAGWHESAGPVTHGSAVVRLPRAALDTREVGDLWIERVPPERT